MLDNCITDVRLILLMLCYVQIWLNGCPDDLTLCIIKDVGDIFVIFWSPQHLEKFNEYLNKKHANIKFTNEKEVDRALSFLDALISLNKEGFTTTGYHKPTFSEVYSNSNSFIANEYKHGLILTLLFRMFSIVSKK